MDKRYQVFVSSTFKDLSKERQAVMQTLMKMDCIPAGMELFPAIDEETFEFIKKIIDDCDYYLIIIGGRYGSLTSDGISFTEKEYDYAISKGLKVIALVHSNPEKLSVEKSDVEKPIKKKLETFRKKVMSGRLVDLWSDVSELPGKVALNVMSTIKRFPTAGWVRANQIASVEILEEINSLRKENDDLKRSKSEETSFGFNPRDLAEMDEFFEFEIGHYKFIDQINRLIRTQKVKSTWRELFSIFSPKLIVPQDQNSISAIIAGYFSQDKETNSSVISNDLETIKVQFLAYGFVDIVQGARSRDVVWTITDLGKRSMLTFRAIKSKKNLER